MGKLFTALTTLLLIYGCNSTHSQDKYNDYLDLRHNELLVEKYWTIKRRVPPHFPMEAARKNVSGCVELTVGINKNGKPTGYSVNKSYPEGVFDFVATEAIGQWRWKPANNDIEAKPILMTVELGFFLDAPRNQNEVEANCAAVGKQS